MNRQILNLAIPNIIANISVPLLGAIDTALVGHMEGIHHLGAIAIGSAIFSFIYMGLGFLSMGTTGMTAQAYGADDNREILLVFVRSIVVALIMAMLLVVFQGAIAWGSFPLFQSSPEVERYAKEYFFIRIWAAPATLMLLAIQGWFLGLQNARYPMFLSIVVNIINIGANLLFVFGFDMKSDGVAWGTVVAQYGGCGLGWWLFYSWQKRHPAPLHWPQVWDWEPLRRFFSINSDLFIRTISLMAVLSFFTIASSWGGDAILAANSILMQLWLMISFGMDGFADAAQSLVGRYFGARDAVNLRRCIRHILAWGLGLGSLFGVLYLVAGESILGLFTNKTDIIALAMQYMAWIIFGSVLNCFAFLWDGIYVGATAAKPMRNCMILCSFGIFFPAYWLTYPILENHGLWLAMFLFMIMRGASLMWLAPKHIYVLEPS